MKRIMTIAAALMLSGNLAFAAEAIEGNWKTASGETAVIGPCGSAFCVTLKTGKHAGKQIGNSLENSRYGAMSVSGGALPIA